MLIRPVSDLHSEFWKYYKTDKILQMVIPPLPTDARSVLVIAGDFGLECMRQWKDILEILSERFMQTLYVVGNHFFYNSDKFDQLENIIKESNRLSKRKTVGLENTTITITLENEDPVTFIGANLWTDFNKRNPIDMLAAQNRMNDFRLIKKSDRSIITPEVTVYLFDVSKKYIFKKLKSKIKKKTVVITHHGCSPLSISNHYKYDDLNPAYVTDLTNEIMDNGPDLWIHGHIHDSADYMIGKTRVIVNPYGYKDHNENLNYQKDLVIEI